MESLSKGRAASFLIASFKYAKAHTGTLIALAIDLPERQAMIRGQIEPRDSWRPHRAGILTRSRWPKSDKAKWNRPDRVAISAINPVATFQLRLHILKGGLRRCITGSGRVVGA